MTYTGTMVLPKNAMIMPEQEMRYLEGGRSIPMSPKYLSKSNCSAVGKKYKGYNGMSALSIAKEVYAHAYLYYMSPSVIPSIVTALLRQKYSTAIALTGALYYIRDRGKSVELGGDNNLRLTVYNYIWYNR